MVKKAESAGEGIKVSNAGWVFDKKVVKNFQPMFQNPSLFIMKVTI